MIMLMGLVTKNAILIVDFTNQLKEKGLPVREGPYGAGKRQDAAYSDDYFNPWYLASPIALAAGPHRNGKTDWHG